MRAVIQRVNNASVTIENKIKSSINKGLLIFVGIEEADNLEDISWLSSKITQLRIFDDLNGVMNLSVKDIDGEVLIISQFTLYGETAKGKRPNFTDAAKPDEAIPLYKKFVSRVKTNLGDDKVKEGIFGAMMDVQLVNYGPVTVLVESNK